MTLNEKKMTVKAVQLSGYEMSTLKDAKQTLKILFGRLSARDNINHVANMFNDLERLIEELDDNNNSIIEFSEEDK